MGETDPAMGSAAADFMPGSLHTASFADPNPLEICKENWDAAESVIREVIHKVQVTSVSEERRRRVAAYIQRLIRTSLGVEVFPYGSVPLKTYLPDGDIDLTAFGGVNNDDTLANDIKSVLEEEANNIYAEFAVKDVQMINAEVKLVKCIVQDIVVDVSFNQIGGLCTLCFLEQVDRLIGKDNLFKRSIILIKAWCYYESRILGAHHGLISTYALETLVLYIFNVFHSMLDGPLAVLYKFLEYFSKFDWDMYCVSLSGPARLSSLPDIVAQMPEDGDKDFLLSIDFLSSCVSMFSVPSRVGDRTSRGFQLKHLNILDPLKEFNNLGRSVSKGNFYRIRSAFLYGARKLKQILLQPKGSIASELHKFFSNTMARHGSGQRPDVQDFDLSLVCSKPISGARILETMRDNLNEFLLHPVSTADSQSNSDSLSQEKVGTSRHMENREHHNSSDNLATSGLGSLQISEDSSVHQPRLPKKSDGSKSDAFQDQDNENNEAMALTGDYEAYLHRLQYGRWCYSYGINMHIPRLPPLVPYQNGSTWGEGALPQRNGFSRGQPNGFHSNAPVHAMQHVVLPGVTFGWDEGSKPRGTGTYFPNMNQPPKGYRPSGATKARSPAQSRSPRNNVIFEPHGTVNRSAMASSHQLFSANANGEYIHPEGADDSESSPRAASDEQGGAR